MKFAGRWARCGWQAITAFLNNEGFIFASHIALSILLAIFPFLIVVTTMAGFFGSGDLANTAASLLLEIWPSQVAEPLIRELTTVMTSSRGDLLTLGSALSLYFASNAIEALRAALNRAYEAPETRPWWRTRLQSLVYAVLGAVSMLLLALLIVLGPLAFELVASYVPALTELRPAFTFTRYALAVVALVVTLAAMHLWLPAGHRRIRDIMPGIIFTVIASLVAGAAFGQYLTHFASSYVSTYAGLASPIIALVYLNYVAIIFIFGGELNQALLPRKPSPQAPAEQ